jgi:hypothetical protein
VRVLRLSFAAVLIAACSQLAYADLSTQLADLQQQINQLQTQISALPHNNSIALNPTLSWQMMGNMSGVGKELDLLTARQTALNTPLTIGGFTEADAIYQNTSSEGFNALPLSNGASFGDATGTDATQLFLSNADISATGIINSWAMAYMQLGAKNVGGINSQDDIVWQDAYLVAGNLVLSPIYGFVGKKEIDFGSFASVNMYNSPLTRDLFEALGNEAGVGYNSNGFNGTVSVMNGGTTGADNKYTTNSGEIGNFAVNLSYSQNLGDMSWNFGTGYIRGSRFVTTDSQTNGAWDLNGKLSVAGFDLLAEYVQTVSQSYGKTFVSNLSDVAQTINAWDIGTDYHFPIVGINSVASLDYSQADLAYGGNNLLQQIVAGYRIEPINSLWTGLEYSYNQNGVDPQTGALYGSGYHSHTILLDVTAVF